MNETQKNILTDIVYSFDGLQESLRILLREQQRQARRAARRPGGRSEYEEAVRACRGLERTIRMVDDVMDSARDAMGGREAAAS